MIPVIIPYFKKKYQLDKCIDHLKAQTVPVEIYIRDNNTDNVYFTAAVNEGIRNFMNTPCEYLFLLNQDMYLERTAIEKMIVFMDSHDQCGIGAPLQLHSEDPGYAIWAGSYEAFPVGIHQHGKLEDFQQDEELYWANGACMILRKRMIREIGLLDENFVFIGSDSDYCFTARSRGWQVWRIAGARGIHEHGASGEISNSEVEILKLNDMIYFGRKWLTGDLFREMAFEGEDANPQKVRQILNKMEQVKLEHLQKLTSKTFSEKNPSSVSTI